MSQTQKLLDLLSDGCAHSTPEILQKVYGSDHLGIARISARIFGIKKKGYIIRSFRDENKKTVTWYQLLKTPIVIEETEINKDLFTPGKITPIAQTLFPLPHRHL